MQYRSLRAVAAIALAATALLFTACSSDDSSSSSGSSTTSAKAGGGFESGTSHEGKEEGAAPASTTPPNLPKPTAEELNSKITRAFDGSVAEQEKVTWIEDADRDPELVDKLVAAAKQNKVKIEITKVGDPKDGKLKADADVTIDGKPVENGSVDFVAVGDQWQIAHEFACSIVKSAKLDSAACQQ
ncbi:hypothetical protein OG563_06545 [Nocardia vinacea]|uniref:Low molecular weight antigen MTB12-like C-terminal domain-containing protein n=1 Tax=Nocardia vinacea TaxID=96468 RepID=A0ABZ1YXY5_9NOCA|nr:hypothetical protein [Nocardia vinacea]